MVYISVNPGKALGLLGGLTLIHIQVYVIVMYTKVLLHFLYSVSSTDNLNNIYMYVYKHCYGDVRVGRNSKIHTLDTCTPSYVYIVVYRYIHLYTLQAPSYPLQMCSRKLYIYIIWYTNPATVPIRLHRQA